MSDAYALALLIGMPLYAVFLLTRIGTSRDGELHWVRALAATMLVVAAASLLLQMNRLL